MRLALIEDTLTAVTSDLDFPLERALREAGKEAALESVDALPCSFTGPDHVCRLPPGMGVPATQSSSDAIALETDFGSAFVYPPLPDFIAALEKAAADPDTFTRPSSSKLREHPADASAHVDAAGTTTLTMTAEFDHPVTRRWHDGVALYYRLRWKGQDVAVLLPGRMYGGLGRLAAAASASELPFIGVSRGGTFGSTFSDINGRALVDALEKAGLRWSAVGPSEIDHWPELLAYRRERPGGIGYLSANLVYSTDTDRTVLPPYAVVDASGTRVALVGVTPELAGELLPRVGLGGYKVLDPGLALGRLMKRLHGEADVVVALAALDPSATARVAAGARGLDLLLGESASHSMFSPPPSTTFVQHDRPIFGNPLPPMRVYRPAFNAYDVDRRVEDDRTDWTVTSAALLLDDSVNPAEGYPEPDMSYYVVGSSIEAPVIPAARTVFDAKAHPAPYYDGRDFWTLAAGLLAEHARAEAGLLPTAPLPGDALGGVRERMVREWLGPPEAAVVVAVPGARLKGLADEAAEQRKKEDAHLPVDAKLRFTVSGFDPKGLLRGAPLDANGVYLLATSRLAAEELALPKPYDLIAGTPTVGAAVLHELRGRADAPPSDWRGWLEGRPLSEDGLWRVNFRDVGLNVRQTKVQSSDAFATVPNSRVQGSDELLIGGVFKTDAEYLHREYKWTNTLEMEYAKDRISPRNGPATTNLSSNRIMFLTLDTKRLGGIPYSWLAHSWGPSIGLQYDGEFQAAPGLRRKQVYSAFPGLEFFDGTVVKTLSTSGILKRDLSRDPPNTQTGLRVRALVSAPVGPGGAKLDGELWNNYFFLTNKDNDSDLRVEGDANAKLSIPIRKHLSVAPFIDFYWFGLKTRPVYGYSLMTGVSISFTRLWKPQYESF